MPAERYEMWGSPSHTFSMGTGRLQAHKQCLGSRKSFHTWAKNASLSLSVWEKRAATAPSAFESSSDKRTTGKESTSPSLSSHKFCSNFENTVWLKGRGHENLFDSCSQNPYEREKERQFSSSVTTCRTFRLKERKQWYDGFWKRVTERRDPQWCLFLSPSRHLRREKEEIIRTFPLLLFFLGSFRENEKSRYL